MPYKGLLRIEGEIDTAQFWPQGQSDADTVHIELNVTQNSFKFRKNKNSPFQTTKVFWNGKVSGKDVVVKLKSGIKKIKVRLQGIDAPEMHYKLMGTKKPDGMNNTENNKWKAYNKTYRQHMSYLPTVMLAELCKDADKNAGGKVKCTFETLCDQPGNVCDIYGRFVGDIIVHFGNKSVNINNWLLYEGLVFPSYYNSLSKPEIVEKNAAWEHGKNKVLSAANFMTYNMGMFNEDLMFGGAGKKFMKEKFMPDPAVYFEEDIGYVVNPKLYRRQVEWYVFKKIGRFNGSFKKFLESKSKPDLVFLASEYIPKEDKQDQLTKHKLYEYLDYNGDILFGPEDLIFLEKDSTLKDKNYQVVTGW